MQQYELEKYLIIWFLSSSLTLNRKLSSRKTRASHSEFFAIKVNFRNQSSAWLSWCWFDLRFWDVWVFSCSLSPWRCEAWRPPQWCWGSHWSGPCPPRGGSPGFSSAGSGFLSLSGPSSAARETQQTCWDYSVYPLLPLLLLLPISTIRYDIIITRSCSYGVKLLS